MTILVFSTLTNDLQAQLQQQFPTSRFHFVSNLKEERIPELFRQAEILLGNPSPKLFASAPEQLKFWQLDSAGFDQYKMVSTQASIGKMGVFYSKRCAETVLAGLVAYYRKIHLLIRYQQNGEWKRNELLDELDLLSEKKVIFLGAGSIAQHIDKLLKAFDCETRFMARVHPKASIHSRQELIRQIPAADILINTLPGTADQFVDMEIFQHMREDALYVSIGRGNTTKEEDLILALQQQLIAGAILDVTEQEPLPTDHAFWTMEQVILTQHTGGADKRKQKGVYDTFVSNFKRYLSTERPENLVEITKGY